MAKKFFWLDGFTGTAEGGFFFRDDSLKKIHEKCASTGKKLVCIVYNDEDPFNLELLLEALVAKPQTSYERKSDETN